MTTITDLIPDVIAYLVAQCQANTALGAASPPVTVIDGPTGAGEPLTTPQQMWIGFDAVTGTAEAGTATQKFSFLGQSGNYRDETGDVCCTAQAWSGDVVPGPARAQCKALVGAVEVMLRGSPATGGPGDSSMAGLVQWSQVAGPFTWTQRQDNNGYSVACVFHVTYFARLAP
jgi:hypothetical protein